MSEVSGSIAVSGLRFLFIFVLFSFVFTVVLRLLSACTLERGAPFTAPVPYSFLTLTGRAPPALHLR